MYLFTGKFIERHHNQNNGHGNNKYAKHSPAHNGKRIQKCTEIDLHTFLLLSGHQA